MPLPWPLLHLPALVSATDLVLPTRTMIHSRADRCIDLNDHGQLRGQFDRGNVQPTKPGASPARA
jgi:hypothetical protein